MKNTNSDIIENWIDLGSVNSFSDGSIKEILIDKTKISITRKGNEFGVISGVCNHVGGPLGEGKLNENYVVCPWHYWKFHFQTGEGEPGYEEDKVPSYKCKVEDEHLFVDINFKSRRNKSPHDPHPLARPIKREPGHVRFVEISTTVMPKIIQDSAHKNFY